MSAAPAGLVLLTLFLAGCVRAQNNFLLLQELFGSSLNDTDGSKVAVHPDVLDLNTRPPCVLVNNYCGRIVPGTGLKKECCGDLVCHRNKCRRPTCC